MDKTAEAQLKTFIAKFEPKNQAFIRALRGALKKRLPTANELVYGNYHFFVIAYCSTERASDAILSLAADANGVGLHFYLGARLPDPRAGIVIDGWFLFGRAVIDLQPGGNSALIAFLVPF